MKRDIRIDANVFRYNLYRMIDRGATQDEIFTYIGAYAPDGLESPAWRLRRERCLAKVDELKAKYGLA